MGLHVVLDPTGFWGREVAGDTPNLGCRPWTLGSGSGRGHP